MSIENNSPEDLTSAQNNIAKPIPKSNDIQPDFNSDDDIQITKTPKPKKTKKESDDKIKKDFYNFFQQIIESISENKSNILELLSIIKEKNERDKYKDEAIIRMQKRLEEYERDLLKSIKEAVIKDIILFYDSLTKFSKKFESGSFSNEEFNKEIKLLKDELLEILFAQNIELIDSNTKQQYDRNYQKVIGTEPTDNADENEIVYQINREGFIWNGNILRKQEVIVKKFSDKMQNENDISME